MNSSEKVGSSWSLRNHSVFPNANQLEPSSAVGGRHANSLPGQTTFTKKVRMFQYGDDRFFAIG